MILECSQCNTRYLVPDTAIGSEGRTVRCANCRHSWFQQGVLPPSIEDPTLVKPEPIAPAAAAPPPTDPVQAQPAMSATPTVSSYAEPADFRPRRNPARRQTIVAIVAGLIMLIAAIAIVYSGAPGLAQQLGLPIGPGTTPLKFDDKAQSVDRRQLASGSELFAIAGRVVNPTGSSQHVPNIRVDLKDAQKRIVYSWTIAPQQRSLNPGGTMDFNSAKLDVPANSKMLELSFSGESAR